MWILAAVGGVLVVATGWLPRGEAIQVALVRGGPVLGFLVAITLLSELADRAGVFDVAATACARLARGSALRLYLLLAVLGTVTTIAMSLDTTAVLLTPVVLTITERLGLRPVPFALLAVWLANTASLLLPVSNLTNLLALQTAQLSSLQFAKRMALPELAAVAVTVVYLAVLFRRDLRVRYPDAVSPVVADRVLLWGCGAACVALAPGVVLGVPPWLVGSVCAALAVALFAVRCPGQLRWRLVPWRIIVLTEGLFLVVSAVARHGASSLIGRLVGTSTLGTAAAAATTSDVANNLPAYLAVEPVVPHGATTQLLGVLLGTNAGPLILLWGSLATLLWREGCRSRAINIPAWRFAAVGLGGVPLVLVASSAALVMTG